MERADSTEAWMVAVESRDPRFDGWVTVGVSSTGIYCRPSCPTPVRPKRANMRFFPTPAAAQEAGFRACKRCAPDATPGSPEWNRRDDLVARAVRAIDDGVVDRVGVSGLAESLAVSSRHLNRILRSEVGATPVALARARRARAARSLIRSTQLSFTDIAFASGFDSVRQFNDTIREVFATTPTALRGNRSGRVDPWIDIPLPLRTPYDVDQVWQWLGVHAIAGVEEVDDGFYRRSLRLPGGAAVVEVTASGGGAESSGAGPVTLSGRVRLNDLSDLPLAINRIRRLFDLDADPAAINPVLSADPVLAPMVERRPGLRSPGEVSGLDGAVRAVAHQQVSVAAAATTLSRLVARYGVALEEPVGTVTHVMPTAEAWAGLDVDTAGMPKRRAATLAAVAEAVADGGLDLGPAADRDQTRRDLLALPGIGPWTTEIIALRALADPDVVVRHDLALERMMARLGSGGEEAGETDLSVRAERWRPWRSYGLHHLWCTYLEEQNS